MPICAALGATGSTSLRSTARPPVSAMRTKICASCGRLEDGGLARLTGKVAMPLSSVSGSPSIGVRSLEALSSSATPN